MAKGYRIIGLLSLLLALPMVAKKPVLPNAFTGTLSVEQKQQFTYYWYAAKQALLNERYPDAMVLLQFCEQLNPHDGQTQELLGIMYDALGDHERAFAAYEKAFTYNPHDQWPRYVRALLSRQTAEGRRQALTALEQAHQVNPKDEDLLEQLRRLYLSVGQCKKALGVQDEIDAIRGYDVYSAYNRMSTYAVWGKPKKAIAEADKWLETEPTNIQFMLYRIELMERSGAKTKDLIEWYERVLKIDPRNLMVMNNYAYLIATHGGDLRQAEQMSQITIREEPDNPVYLDTYGWIMYLQGQNDLALFYLRKALDKSDENTQIEIRTHLNAVMMKTKK